MPVLGGDTRTFELEVVAGDRLAFVDITDYVTEAVRSSGVREGVAIVFCRHTTAAVLINEAEAGLEEDVRSALGCLVPEGYFAHDDLSRRTQNLQGGPEPPNGSAHVRHVLLGGTSETIPIRGGELGLGRWQRVLFLELDEPRPRTPWIEVLGL